MQRRTYLYGLVSTLTIAGLAGCSDTESTGRESGSNEDQDRTQDQDTDTDSTDEASASGELVLEEHELVEDDLGFAEIAGRLTNDTGSDQDYVEVNGYFYDENDERIGDTMWNAENVRDGETLQFETVMSSTDYVDVASYEVEAQAGF